MTEPETLRRALEEMHGASLAWAVACCRFDRMEAEDVLQNTYIKILEKKAVFDGRSSLKTWLFSVIRRTAADRRRRTILGLLGLERFKSEAGSIHAAADPERVVSDAQGGRRMRDLLRAIPGRQREVLELVFYQEMTIEEAARVMDVSLGTARVHYERGKKRCLAMLDAEGAR